MNKKIINRALCDIKYSEMYVDWIQFCLHLNTDKKFPFINTQFINTFGNGKK